uniref:Uncharacterized protein n=1 Tax=Catagonus wagneri TaxID=51154 RepID=A0A8C4FGZ6_9CETA
APMAYGGSQPSPTWLPEDRQVGLPTGQLCVGEHHHTILGGFVETKHSCPRPLGTLTDGVYPCDHLVLAQVLAGLVVRLWLGPLPLGAASIRAGWALLTLLPKGPWLRALALAADAVPAVAADLAIPGLARADVCRAVTVVPNITCVALAFSTVTLAMA